MRVPSRETSARQHAIYWRLAILQTESRRRTWDEALTVGQRLTSIMLKRISYGIWRIPFCFVFQEGAIETDDHTLFIEPFKENTNSLKSIHRKHIVYRSNDIIHDKTISDRGEKEPIDGNYLLIPWSNEPMIFLLNFKHILYQNTYVNSQWLLCKN